MSILIKGMNMPNDCCQCKLARYDDYENETFCPFTDVMCLSIGRQDNCPLEEVPETHDKRTETHACDLIDRQAAIDAILNCERGEEVFMLENLPSAQPEPSMEQCACCVLIKPERKKGRWIIHGEPPMYVKECSVCGEKFFHHQGQELTPYCSMCGAEMRGEE